MFLDDGPRPGMRLHRADALGVERLRAAGYRLLILSRQHTDALVVSAHKLQVPFHGGVEEKRRALEAWARDEQLPLPSISYLGNGLDDIDCLTAVGWGCAAISARPEVKVVAQYVSPFPGGCRAFGDVAERILAARTNRP